MNTWVAVTTHEPMDRLRTDLLEDTIESINEAFPSAHKLLLDNGSNDESGQYIRNLPSLSGWHQCWYIPIDGNHTPGRGRRHIMDVLEQEKVHPDVVVWSDDDMRWRLGAQQAIESFWSDPADDVAVLCGYVEPDFRWSSPTGNVECGSVRAVVRESVPGCAWSMRWDRWSRYIRTVVKDGFGYDYKACRALVGQNKRLAAVDLAEHIGWNASSHGNMSNRCAAELDKRRWGLA